jgi:rhamnulokinase
MKDSRIHLAVDLGASSGRIIAGAWEKDQLRLDEIHRFPSPSLYFHPYHYWDLLRIFAEIVEGLQRAQEMFGERLASIGVDTWGVDYAFLDENGELLANPIQYRDPRTEKSYDEVLNKLGPERIYGETGIQFLRYNTLYQLAADKQERRGAFLQARHLLFMPDLINYWLTGKLTQERTIASTSQLLNPVTGNWSEALLTALGLPDHLFGPITEPGTVIGPIRENLVSGLHLSHIDVIAVTGHDTASAVAATPFRSPESAFLSSGTWSIMGRELTQPNLTDEARRAGFSNEIGLGGSVRFLKNITGMWLIEELRRNWAQAGRKLSYSEILELAGKAPARRSFIDPDAPELATPGDMPARITESCRRHGQPEPADPGAMLRVVFDSIVMKYRYTFQLLESLEGVSPDGIHLIGGGARNDFLNQLSADSIGVPVHAGPYEATALGNIVAQLIALHRIPDIGSAREIIAHSFPAKSFTPRNTTEWADEDARFRELTSRSRGS